MALKTEEQVAGVKRASGVIGHLIAHFLGARNVTRRSNPRTDCFPGAHGLRASVDLQGLDDRW